MANNWNFCDIKAKERIRSSYPSSYQGGGYHPLTVCLRPHKNAKESDPGHLRHLFYILCGHFDEKKIGGTP